jgi:hypothetical protein
MVARTIKLTLAAVTSSAMAECESTAHRQPGVGRFLNSNQYFSLHGKRLVLLMFIARNGSQLLLRNNASRDDRFPTSAIVIGSIIKG